MRSRTWTSFSPTHEGLTSIGVFVLKSWLLECAFNREWSVKSMLHRAALSNKFTCPGRYVIPSPLLLQDAEGELARAAPALRAGYDDMRTATFHS